MSERDGKASGWRAMFSDGKWVEEGTAKKPKAKRKTKPKAKAKAKAKKPAVSAANESPSADEAAG